MVYWLSTSAAGKPFVACAALRTAGAEDGREAACSIGRGGLPCCGYPHASAAPCRREGWGGFCRRGRDKHTGGAAYRADRAVSAEKAGGCRSRAGPAARTAAWKGASPPFCPCRIADPARGSPCLPSPSRASPKPGEQQREAETGMGGMCRPASRGTGRIGQPGRALLSVRADGTGGDAASRARPWFYSCMPSTRLASRTFSGSSSKT